MSCTSGLGSSILTSINGNNQFKHWFMYFLMGFGKFLETMSSSSRDECARDLRRFEI